MRVQIPRAALEIAFEEAAREYLRRLPPEHFMEWTPQATQRGFTLASFDLVRAQRADVHFFSELLVQYQLPRRKSLGQVVPDNMVVVHPDRIKAMWSYDVPLQPAGPFWVIDYVCAGNARKDYDGNRAKYEHELKVPYYLLFTADARTLTLYRHSGTRYVRTRANAQGRYEISELELEVGLHDGWMRYWFRGDLLPLPAEMHRELAKVRKNRRAVQQELEKLRAEVERLKQAQTKRSGPNGESS